MYKILKEFDELPIECQVGDAKTSGRIYVPKELIGRKVVVALIPEVAAETALGMPTEELIAKLTNAIDMPVEDWAAVFEKGKLLGDLPSSKYPNQTSYNDAVDELLEVVRSENVGEIDPKQAFCFGAFVGMLYHPHMSGELDRKAENLMR